MVLWDHLVSDSQSHCFLYNSGLFRNGAGEMPLKYHVLTKIQAPLPTPFSCVILAFWTRVVDSREERGTVSSIYVHMNTRQETGKSCCPVWWAVPQTTQRSPLCSPSSTGEIHLPFQVVSSDQFSLPKQGQGLTSCDLWAVFSTQTDSETMLDSTKRQGNPLCSASPAGEGGFKIKVLLNIRT